MFFRRFILTGLAICASAGGALAGTPAGVSVQIEVDPGLKFDPPRFAVEPGADVTVRLHNGDEMIHNFVLTRPGMRLKVVTAALALGADGPGRNFVPALPEILASTRALNPGESAVVRFTAPLEEGVYPYVCTFPGHGFVMFGAMYVTRGGLPPLAGDRNIPPGLAAAATGPGDGLLVVRDRPIVSRTFLPDCGPAAIAVGLPGGQSFCFDAALGQLRYAWRGGFIDSTDQWASKGNLWTRVLGRVYYRAPIRPWLRIGRPDRLPVVKWRGYDLRGGYPVFDFDLDGHRVREVVHPRPVGSGLEIAYTVTPSDLPVYLVIDPAGGASFAASAGRWDKGVLALAPREAALFDVVLTERPKVEPLRYWSMNDVLWRSEDIDPKPGVVGRAFTPGGEEPKQRPLLAGIGLSELKGGATLISWVKLADDLAAGRTEPIFSAGGTILVGAPVLDRGWHHVAAVYPPGERGRLTIDGVPGNADLPPLPDSAEDMEIGSVRGRYFHGLLDEVRIYDRVLAPDEIARLYRREAEIGNLPHP